MLHTPAIPRSISFRNGIGCYCDSYALHLQTMDFETMTRSGTRAIELIVLVPEIFHIFIILFHVYPLHTLLINISCYVLPLE